MDIWIYGYMDIWIYGYYMDIWILYGYMDIWILGYMDISDIYTHIYVSLPFAASHHRALGLRN